MHAPVLSLPHGRTERKWKIMRNVSIMKMQYILHTIHFPSSRDSIILMTPTSDALRSERERPSKSTSLSHTLRIAHYFFFSKIHDALHMWLNFSSFFIAQKLIIFYTASVVYQSSKSNLSHTCWINFHYTHITITRNWKCDMTFTINFSLPTLNIQMTKMIVTREFQKKNWNCYSCLIKI